MERKIELVLKKWKKEKNIKPLILYGAKQVGKTFTVLKFAKENYSNHVYFNLDNNKIILDLFMKEKNTDKLIDELSKLSNQKIFPEDTLVILDNLSNNEITKTLKLFERNVNKYHIIAITSRRDKLKEFKGEELQFRSMNEMDFEEFLWANNENKFAEVIKESFVKRKTCAFHKIALEYFYEYLITGGYPEVIYAKKQGKSAYEIDAIKQKIINVIKSEINLTDNLIDIPRGIAVFDSIPEQLNKSNKKFQYGILGQGKRASEYENSINNFVNNQILYKSYRIKDVKSPLSSCKDKDSFKLYLPDDGILVSMLHIDKNTLLSNEDVKETVYENHVAKSLVENGFVLYYYTSDGKAEVNFVVQNRMGKIIPIEITTKTNSKAKSLSFFMKKHKVEEAFRITENNFATKKEVRYIPIYAMFCLDELM